MGASLSGPRGSAGRPMPGCSSCSLWSSFWPPVVKTLSSRLHPYQPRRRPFSLPPTPLPTTPSAPAPTATFIPTPAPTATSVPTPPTPMPTATSVPAPAPTATPAPTVREDVVERLMQGAGDFEYTIGRAGRRADLRDHLRSAHIQPRYREGRIVVRCLGSSLRGP